jgi:hypothetical protein
MYLAEAFASVQFRQRQRAALPVSNPRMGDAKRRKAEIERLRRDNLVGLGVVAVHESGHAVARFLTASDLGYEPDEAISYIEVHDAGTQAASRSLDGRMSLRFQAVTFGPKLSKEMQEASRPLIASVAGRPLSGIESRDLIMECVKAARASGADIDKWLHARAIIAVSGAMAEAKFKRRTFEDVWAGYECENDVAEIVGEGICAGLEAAAVETIIDRATEVSEKMMAQPEIWRAVLKLAAALPLTGRIAGEQVIDVIARALKAQDSA